MRKLLGVLALFGSLCLLALAQPLTGPQIVDGVISTLRPLESRLTSRGVTNLKNILTRLNTLKGQFKPEPVPVPVPVPEPTPTPTPTPVPEPTPTPTPSPTPTIGCGAPVTSPSGPHAFYDTARSLPSCQAAYSLREQTQIEHYRNLQQARVSYDPVFDAAKWNFTIAGETHGDQLRLPIRLERPASGSTKLLIISDHRWDSAWLTEFINALSGDYIGGWKWLQVTCATDPTNPRQRICFEPQSIHAWEWFPDAPKPVWVFAAREYLGVRAPTVPMDTTAPCGAGKSFGEVVGPVLNCFKAYPNTWTRAWLQIELKAGDDFASVSWWMADENQNPVPIYLNAQVRMNTPVLEFWYEYDSSVELRKGGAMAAWGRNVVVLKDADVNPLLQKPVK